MEILNLDKKVAEAMLSVFGEKIFKSRDCEGTETMSVTLNDNVILKCYGYDGSVRVDLGAMMFILERDHYWRITIR